ncbi:hypothetical protein AALB64_01510 [Lachnospiraceae bacterium 45-P1]
MTGMNFQTHSRFLKEAQEQVTMSSTDEKGGNISDLQEFWKNRVKSKRYRYGVRVCMDSR